jgi:poly(3-hydroxybutyrate) depolymerase
MTTTPGADAGRDGNLNASPGCGKPWTGPTGKWVPQPTGCVNCAPGGACTQQGTSACQIIPPGGVVPPMATSGSPEYRGWWVYVPIGYDASKPYTVIYNGAGAEDSNWFHAGADGLPYQNVDNGQAILVGLDYDTYSYLLGAYDVEHANSNDLSFMPWLMDEIENTFCVDTSSEWMSGYSEGATLAQQFDCAFPSRLRGEVTVGGWEPGSPQDRLLTTFPKALPPCNPAPTAAFFVHDIGDTIYPYSAVLPGCSRILTQNGCTNTKCDPSDPTLTTPYSVAAITGQPPTGVDLSVASATCVEFNGCPPEYPVVFCTTNYMPNHHADGEEFGVVHLFWDFMTSLTPACQGVDTQNDPNNCGRCGAKCPNALEPYSTLCISGMCACPNTCLFRDGMTHCVDELTDPNFCGSCYLSCPTTAPFCRGGQCSAN